jgi:hypothetical protein
VPESLYVASMQEMGSLVVYTVQFIQKSTYCACLLSKCTHDPNPQE